MSIAEKFINWQENVSKKSEQDKHNYAITITFLLVGIITFFVASGWYYSLFGYNLAFFETSYLAELEQMFDFKAVGNILEKVK